MPLRQTTPWISLLTCVLGICACDEESVANPSETWMRPTDLGKADVVVLASDEIPSAFAAPGAEYFFERNIETLEEVGALSGAHAELARRADGIIPALPANGRIDIEELVRLENPVFFATLFPEEQAALPELWPHLEAPSGPTNTPMFTDFEPLVANDVTVDPGVLGPPPSASISTLSISVQEAAQRVQLIANDDGDSDTISVSDLDTVLADPFAFTPAEVDRLGELRRELQAEAVSSADARVEVPEIRQGGVQIIGQGDGFFIESASLANVSVSVRTVTALDETHGYTRRAFLHFREGFDVTIELRRTREVRVALASTQRVIFLNEITGNEFVARSGTIPGGLAAGRYTVERYSEGTRTHSERVELPDLSAGSEVVDISEYAGFDFVQTDGVPLFRHLLGTDVEGSDPAHITEFIDFTESGPSTLEYPDARLPAGRYDIDTDLGAVVLELFPAGAMRFTDWQGESVWMGWRAAIGGGLRRQGQTEAIRAVYNSGRQELSLFTRANNADVIVALHGADRSG